MTKREETLAFVEAKLALAVPFLGPDKARPWTELVAGLRTVLDRVPLRSFREGDREMDLMIGENLSAKDVAGIRAALIERFGYATLGETPAAVVARVMKRGKVRDDEEAMLVRDFLSGDYGGTDAPEEQRTKLGEIFGAFEMRSK